ncbi:sodium:proton antiporter [Mergibacter septicus]|uniref:Sodium:proton antiporter n=1 Tax=Mergibacter septicus TaxID=221402 RepID=A0A8D4LK87_9PAST|nr:Na+/H+ antiporter family protein [Mergibacter septicus]AWX16300.1 sodium:proton antiporter [Mergibacter septicus]QDJ15550.1 sodium:proton antiporter [Mergibacter septicus]UTU48868.1 Na+/H+ antiporter family protein [Mergibacter septicus]WMR96828.1 Na+/H+ antiporter family protein [Mergibacter septicus]
MLANEVVVSIIVLLGLSLLRINVVIALIISAMVAGLLGGLGLDKTINVFTDGLGGGASVAMNYAVLGAFAVAISRSGLTDLLAYNFIRRIGSKPQVKTVMWFKYILLAILLSFSISSQNIIPVHIAFIPIVVPPLLEIFNRLKLDRRAVACVLTFGLTATYMLLPIGFGKIFIESILVANINQVGQSFNLHTTTTQVSLAMLIPVMGMILGLLFAVFVSYRKPREYLSVTQETTTELEQRIAQIKSTQIWVSVIAILVTFALQLFTESTIIAALVGLMIFALGGIFRLKESNDVFQQGLRLMAMIGFVMIAASGFAKVINATGGVTELVQSFNHTLGANNKGLAAFLMLLVGLFITMGIGSSFSTVPIITSIYVPLCISFGFSELATAAIVGVAAALGDAGSPASDSTLGPTSGLNADGKHDHIWDTVVPTFIHYNIPLLVFGWIAAMVL